MSGMFPSLSTNPFAPLSDETLRAMHQAEDRKRQAQAKYDQLVEAYRDILSDSRYKPIKDELLSVLSEQVEALIQMAADCSRCCVHAKQIQLMRNVIQVPLSEVLASQDEHASEEVQA